MKNILMLVFFFVFLSMLHSQIAGQDGMYYPQPPESEPCVYSSYTLNGNGEIENIQTEAVMVEEWTTPIKGRIIDFTLLKAEQDLILLVEIHTDAEERLQPQCLGSKTTIEFSLRNGKRVKLPQYGPKQCGYINTSDEKTPYYNITNFAYFLIDRDAANQLLRSEVYYGQIESSKYELKFVLASDIYDEVNDMNIYPEMYFMSELECMLNPKLEIEINQKEH